MCGASSKRRRMDGRKVGKTPRPAGRRQHLISGGGVTMNTGIEKSRHDDSGLGDRLYTTE